MQNWHKRRRGCHFTGRVPLRSMACLLFRLRPIGQEIVVTHPRFRLITAVFGTLLALAGPAAAREINLLNVSYDPTREFYR